MVKKQSFFILPLFIYSLFSINSSPGLSVSRNAPTGKTLNSVESIKIEGFVSVDAKPFLAQIEITSAKKHKAFIFNTYTDSGGTFKTVLPNNDEYEIVIRVNLFPQQVILLNATNVRSDSTLNIFADFTSPEYDKKIADLKKSIEKESKKQKIKFSEANFSKKYSVTEIEGLTYKVQVGAFKFFENFNYSSVAGMPKIIRKMGNDNITRFTMGNFKTYSEASALLKQVKKNQLKEAFIVAFYKEDRKMLYQLEEEKIVP